MNCQSKTGRDSNGLFQTVGDSCQLIHQNGTSFVETRLFAVQCETHFIKRYMVGYETQNRLPTPFDGHR